jgi:HEAT repeats
VEHADPRVRASAVEGIRNLSHGRRDDSLGGEELIGLIAADPDPEVRRVTIRELRFVQTSATKERAWEALVRAARTDPAAQVRAAAIDELGDLYGFLKIPWALVNRGLLSTVCIEAADDPDADVRRTALDHLRYFVHARMDGALDAARRHFADPHPQARAMALSAGALVLDEEALRLLRAELADPHVDRAYLDVGAYLDELWRETKIALYHLLDSEVWVGLPDREGWDREWRKKYLWDLINTIRSQHPDE